MTFRARTSGFTLLEVLIAVVVLAFGLLGVVAVFPAVIDVQRRAQDAVIGGSLAASAEAYLNGAVLKTESLDWFDWEDVSTDPLMQLSDVRRFPPREVLTNSAAISVFAIDDTAETADLDFLWDAPAIDADGTVTLGGDRTARRFFGDSVSDPLGEKTLPRINFDVGRRLLPDEASGAAPRYVWDVLVRRVDTGIGVALENDRSEVRVPIDRLIEFPIEMVVFVRPIDRGIRVPAGLTLRDSLRGYRLTSDGSAALARDDLDADERRFPVSVLEQDYTNPQPGLTLANGDARYSQPITIPAGRRLSDEFIASGGTRMDVTRDISIERRLIGPRFSLPSARRALAQVGQLFVDDLGIVHRVTRVFEAEDDGLPRLIEISPPMSPNFRQIVLTPQVPADIRVIRTR